MAHRILVIAGHDSSGRAGLHADREAARSAGAMCIGIVTAWTWQSGDRVHAVDPRPADEWSEEARILIRSGVDAVKVGLLPGAEAVRAIGGVLDTALEAGLPCVVDPVLGASSGEAFLDAEGIEALHAAVLCRPVVLTPNLPEAVALGGREVPGDLPGPVVRRELGEELLRAGLSGLVLKGGHGDEDPVEDLVLEPGREPRIHRHPRVPGAGIRGSGCRHATRLAVGLAAGMDLAAAASEAAEYVMARIRENA
ncbi:MAG TPA: hypothetical protein ENJ09_08560 [Planctomycetes bacterium]|nr:hypothetical protein [Planctomycetota bacterium]